MFVMPVLRCCSGMLNRKIYFLEMLSRPNIFCGKNLQVKNKLAWKNKLIVFLVASDGLYSIYSVPNTYIVGSLSGPMLVYVCFPKRKEAETCDEAINVYFYTKKFVWEGRTIYVTDKSQTSVRISFRWSKIALNLLSYPFLNCSTMSQIITVDTIWNIGETGDIYYWSKRYGSSLVCHSQKKHMP